MTDREGMTYAEAVERIPERELPSFWVGSLEALSEYLDSIVTGTVEQLTESPGGRPIDLVRYGEPEPTDRRANFNSAVASGDPTNYAEKEAREKPVVLLLGPTHGGETEGLTGLVNLIELLETGTDLRGREHPGLLENARQCRVLVIPQANPDGLARFEPASLQGMERADLRFWGQGTWADGTFMGWPEAKQLHPMVGDEVGFLGGYFNDEGINPMHDEFFDPMGPESAAILELARREAPDAAVSLHSFESKPTILEPSYLPMEEKEGVRSILEDYNARLREAGIGFQEPFDPTPPTGSPPPYFNLVSAIYHTSGARSFVHESPHGLTDDDAYTTSHEEILDLELLLFEALFEHVL